MTGLQRKTISWLLWKITENKGIRKWDWKKAKKPEAHKDDMDSSKGLLTVAGTVIIQGGNRHCSLLLCLETSARTYTDLLDCIIKERAASSL